MRRLITLSCEEETLVASLDEADGAAALLIVSGGNEVRAGAHRGMAALAARVAAAGYPVLRFDRRGVGDSTGENCGFRSSAPDIAAAAAALRSETRAERIVGFGNCDAASALALFGRSAGIDAVILANPWVVEPVDDLPPAAAIRAGYAARLRDPAALLRLVTGKVSLPRLARGLRRLAARRETAMPALSAIAAWERDATILLATRDATALAYADAASALPAPLPAIRLDTASHSFADVPDAVADAIVRIMAKAGTTKTSP